MVLLISADLRYLANTHTSWQKTMRAGNPPCSQPGLTTGRSPPHTYTRTLVPQATLAWRELASPQKPSRTVMIHSQYAWQAPAPSYRPASFGMLCPHDRPEGRALTDRKGPHGDALQVISVSDPFASRKEFSRHFSFQNLKNGHQ